MAEFETNDWNIYEGIDFINKVLINRLLSTKK
jgi:hypothetical protein